MSEGYRETACSKCVHFNVCTYREQYMAILEVLLFAYDSIIKNGDEEFVKFVDPECKYFTKPVDIPPFMQQGKMTRKINGGEKI